MQSKLKMEMKINEEKKNALFNRKEVKGVVKSDVAPSRPEVLKSLSEKLKAPEENIKIKGIHGSFGSHEFKVKANIYSSKEEKDKIEFKKKKEEELEKAATSPEADSEGNRAPEKQEPKTESKPESKPEEKDENTEGKSDQPEQEKSEDKDKEEGHEEKQKEDEKGEPEKQ